MKLKIKAPKINIKKAVAAVAKVATSKVGAMAIGAVTGGVTAGVLMKAGEVKAAADKAKSISKASGVTAQIFKTNKQSTGAEAPVVDKVEQAKLDNAQIRAASATGGGPAASSDNFVDKAFDAVFGAKRM